MDLYFVYKNGVLIDIIIDHKFNMFSKLESKFSVYGKLTFKHYYVYFRKDKVFLTNMNGIIIIPTSCSSKGVMIGLFS